MQPANRSVKCSLCPLLLTKADLNTHLRWHEEQTKIKCTLCQKWVKDIAAHQTGRKHLFAHDKRDANEEEEELQEADQSGQLVDVSILFESIKITNTK
jgi:hypothetical protein